MPHRPVNPKVDRRRLEKLAVPSITWRDGVNELVRKDAQHRDWARFIGADEVG